MADEVGDVPGERVGKVAGKRAETVAGKRVVEVAQERAGKLTGEVYGRERTHTCACAHARAYARPTGTEYTRQPHQSHHEKRLRLKNKEKTRT